MRALIVSLALTALTAGCAHVPSGLSADARFIRLRDQFVKTHFAFRPLEAVALGWHEYDGIFAVPTRGALDAEEIRLRSFADRFEELPVEQLSAPRQQELALLRSVIQGQRWIFESQRAPVLNPMFYAGALDISIYIKRDFKPLPQRIRDIAAILRHAPALFAAGRANLDEVLPKPFVDTGIEVAEGTAQFLEKDVAKTAEEVTDPTIRREFQTSSQAAVAEIRAFVAWLKEERLPRAHASFAVGRQAYREMLQSELVDLNPEQVLEAGLRELRAEQQRFTEAAREVDPARAPVDVLKSIQREHPTAANLIPEARKDLDAIRQFVIDHHIVTVPSPVRATVQETLPPFRSTSFASMDTPGPFEIKATEAYYYVTPVEPDWSPAQGEEWLTAFNFYTTDIVSIHEAYPGHYVQFLALNASDATDTQKTFYSYPFVEGWAHYAEEMMLEQGFGQPAQGTTASPEESVKAAKHRLAQSDEALLRLCRLCCSIKLHTQGMTVEEAAKFFAENCYYEPKPARQEAVRGTFDPGYLYYTLGKLMFIKLRQDWAVQEGNQFTLQRFHDEVLRHGCPPLPLLRQIMLRNPKVAAAPL